MDVKAWKVQTAKLFKALKPEILDTLDEVDTWVTGVRNWGKYLDSKVGILKEEWQVRNFIIRLTTYPKPFPTWRVVDWFEKTKNHAKDTIAAAKRAWPILESPTNAGEYAPAFEPYQENINGQPVMWLASDYKGIVRAAINHLNREFPQRPKLPIIVKPNIGGDAAGHYELGTVEVGVDWVSEVPQTLRILVHEHGHHIWHTLSTQAQETWEYLLRQETEFNVTDLKNPGESDLDAQDRLEKTDPVLSVQLAIYFSKGNSLPASGRVRLPRWPVSEYGGSSPIEAFCEALAHIVTEGPRSVPLAVYSTLQEIWPKVGKRVEMRLGQVYALEKVGHVNTWRLNATRNASQTDR